MAVVVTAVAQMHSFIVCVYVMKHDAMHGIPRVLIRKCIATAQWAPNQLAH
jgi:hypothetical protein